MEYYMWCSLWSFIRLWTLSPGQRIIILLVVLAIFKRNSRLGLYIDPRLILKIANLETTRKKFSASHVLSNRLWNVYWVAQLSRKNENSGSIWQKLSIQTAKYYFLEKLIVYQSFSSAPLSFRNFSSRKSSVYRHASVSRLRNVYCLQLSDKISRRKKDISGSAWDHFSFKR